MATEPRAGEAGLISTQVACQLLMMTRQRLGQLAADGWITRLAQGQWRTVDVVQGYIRFLRDEGRRTTKHAADSRVRDARAHEIEVRTAERLGKLVAVEEFDAMIDGICGVTRAELSGLPARVTRDLVVRRAIEREIHGALKRIADTAESIAERLESGRPIDAPLPDDDTRSVGGEQSDVPTVSGDPRPA